jgi:hypothetical protein
MRRYDHTYGVVVRIAGRIGKKALKQDRSERRGELYFVPDLELLSDVKTTLVDFLRILLKSGKNEAYESRDVFRASGWGNVVG